MRAPPPEAAGGPPEAGLLLGLLDADRPEDPAPARPGEGEDVQEPGGGDAVEDVTTLETFLEEVEDVLHEDDWDLLLETLGEIGLMEFEADDEEGDEDE